MSDNSECQFQNNYLEISCSLNLFSYVGYFCSIQINIFPVSTFFPKIKILIETFPCILEVKYTFFIDLHLIV